MQYFYIPSKRRNIRIIKYFGTSKYNSLFKSVLYLFCTFGRTIYKNFLFYLIFRNDNEV